MVTFHPRGRCQWVATEELPPPSRFKAKAIGGGLVTDKHNPTRPRQHELEKASKRAFGSALPASMVERDLPEDYGVDFEVELFDAGDRTGLTFKVQLKSTDSDSSSLSIKLTDFGYWSMLDVPVLLVLFKASTGELLSTWAHAHNPWPPPDGQKTTTVKFETPFAEQLERLPRDLERIREVRASVLRGPVTLRVRDSDAAAVLKLRHALRVAVSDLGAKRFVTVVNDDDAHASVTWHDDKVTVTGPVGMGSVTVHNVNVPDVTDAVGDILATLSVLLLRLGADQVAAQVLIRVRGEVSNGVAEGMAVPLATVLAAAHKWVELCALMESAPTDDAADDVFSVAVLSTSVMDDAAAKLFVLRGRAGADGFAAKGQNEAAARWLMLATFIAVDHHLWSDVDEMLARVPDLTRRHDDDPTLYELVGKAKWNSGDHGPALDNYRRAWDLGWRTEQAVAALGEALLEGGFYAEARAHLDAAYPDGLTRWAILMLCAVDAIVELVGVDQQDRKMLMPDDVEADAVRDAGELLELLRKRDALNAVLLDRYATATKTVSLGVTAWVAIVTGSPLHWARAVLIAGGTEADEPVLKAIVEEAALAQPDVIETLKELQEQLKGPFPDGFLERAAVYAEQAMPYEGPSTVAFSPADILDHA